jgi:hypothetical protein
VIYSGGKNGPTHRKPNIGKAWFGSIGFGNITSAIRRILTGLWITSLGTQARLVGWAPPTNNKLNMGMRVGNAHPTRARPGDERPTARHGDVRGRARPGPGAFHPALRIDTGEDQALQPLVTAVLKGHPGMAVAVGGKLHIRVGHSAIGEERERLGEGLRCFIYKPFRNVTAHSGNSPPCDRSPYLWLAYGRSRWSNRRI